jgi:hypothetical protein
MDRFVSVEAHSGSRSRKAELAAQSQPLYKFEAAANASNLGYTVHDYPTNPEWKHIATDQNAIARYPV